MGIGFNHFSLKSKDLKKSQKTFKKQGQRKHVAVLLSMLMSYQLVLIYVFIY